MDIAGSAGGRTAADRVDAVQAAKLKQERQNQLAKAEALARLPPLVVTDDAGCVRLTDQAIHTQHGMPVVMQCLQELHAKLDRALEATRPVPRRAEGPSEVAHIASRNLELLSRQPPSKLANVVARLISNNEEAVQPSAVHHADKNDISIHSDSQQLSRQQANDDALKALQAELEHEKSSKSEQQAQASGTIEALTKQVQALRADLDLALQEKDAADEKYKASLEPLNQKLSRLQLRNEKLVQSMKAQKQQANAKAAGQALRSSSLAASPALRKLAAIKKLPPLKSESLESPDER